MASDAGTGPTANQLAELSAREEKEENSWFSTFPPSVQTGSGGKKHQSFGEKWEGKRGRGVEMFSHARDAAGRGGGEKEAVYAGGVLCSSARQTFFLSSPPKKRKRSLTSPFPFSPFWPGQTYGRQEWGGRDPPRRADRQKPIPLSLATAASLDGPTHRPTTHNTANTDSCFFSPIPSLDHPYSPRTISLARRPSFPLPLPSRLFPSFPIYRPTFSFALSAARTVGLVWSGRPCLSHLSIVRFLLSGGQGSRQD